MEFAVQCQPSKRGGPFTTRTQVSLHRDSPRQLFPIQMCVAINGDRARV
jgi:hypothetical protein